MWFRSEEPDGYWIEQHSPTYNVELSYRSPQFSAPDRASEDIRPTFEYQVAAGSSRGYVVRVGYPGTEWPDDSRRFALLEAIEKGRRFHAAAQAAIADWPLRRTNDLIARAEAQKRADDLAAYDRYLAGQCQLAETRLATFKADLERITDKIIAEIKQGLVSALEPWLTAVGKLDGVGLVTSSQDQVQSAIDNGRRRVEASLQEAQAARLEKILSGPIPLTGGKAGIVLGTRVDNGEDLILPVRKMQHMLVAGTTGFGKSVFLHQIVVQLLQSREVDQALLIDLKGGVTFNRYSSHTKARVVWDYPDVVKAVADLVDLMLEREGVMRAQNIENWRGGRVFVIIDEYADLQTEIDTASGKEEKEVAKRLSLSLTRISRRARSVGIVLVCALQKPTTDAMDSSLRSNLNCRICFRVGSSQLAASMLDGLDDAPVAPTSLRPGRFIYYDGGKQLLAQAQIAPGIDLAGS